MRLRLRGSLVAALLTLLCSACGSALEVTQVSPPAGSTEVSLLTVPSATFSKPVAPSTVTTSSFLLVHEQSGPVAGQVQVSGDTARFLPAEPLQPGSRYTATLSSGVATAEGLGLEGDFTWSFSTTSTGFGLESSLSGRITYEWVPAKDNVTEGGIRLDYSAEQVRPARRISVQAVDAAGRVVARGSTDDDGRYTLRVPPGTPVTVRALAQIQTASSPKDGLGPEACQGASWDVRIVDNTRNKALYTLASTTTYTPPASNANLNAALTWSNRYTQRQAAPFAILDTLVSSIERVCEANPSVSLPQLTVNWSPSNVPQSGSLAEGFISTSFYTRDGSGQSQLYILGSEDTDTDEYDDHVIAHEFGHFLEDRLYRSDSVGGPHSTSDMLDPRVAFGEGYGNAFSGIAFGDPVYVDTNGSRQGRGFSEDVSAAPGGNGRGVYSEASMQYLLWKLYESRDGTPNSGLYDRLHTVLANEQRATPALTTGLSFAAYYNARYGGSAEDLRALWSSALDSPYNALCPGACTGSGDTADPFDVDNDLGRYYASRRTYASLALGEEFWRLYATLTDSGFAAPGTAHERTLGNTQGFNKLGVQRWYRYVGTGTQRFFRVASPGGASCPAPDDLDVTVVSAGSSSLFESSSGCEAFSVPGGSGRTYIIIVRGFPGAQDVTGWGVLPQ